jgi:hypothetical protein
MSTKCTTYAAAGLLLATLAAACGAAQAAEPEQPIANGRYSPSALYDLGNSYARAGRPGLAVLNYERAHLLAPRDADINANLRRAQESAGTATSVSWYDRQVRYWSPNTMYWLGMFGLMLAASAWLMQRRRPRYRMPLNVLGTAGLILAGLSLCDAAATAPTLHESVVLQTVAAGASPISGAEPLFTEPEAAIVHVQEIHRDHVLIRDAEGRSGWLPRSSLAPIIEGN